MVRAPSLISLQETRTHAISFPGYSSVPFPYNDTLVGTSLCIQDGISWRFSSRHTRELRAIPFIEASVIGILHSSGEYYIGCCYVNPKAPSSSISSLLRYVSTHGLTLIGDFNSKGSFNRQEHHNHLGKTIDRFLLQCPDLLTNFPDDPTFFRGSGQETYSSTLDGLISGDPDLSCSPCSSLLELDSDHAPISVEVSWTRPIQRFSQSPPPKEIHKRINVRKFHGLLQTKLPLPPASSSEIDEKTFEKWVQELTLAITESANKSTYLTHTKRCPYWDKQLDRIKKNLCRAKKRRDQLQTRKLKKRLKSRLRANKRRHEAKIASQVTPINAFSSIYQIAPKARPTRKKQPEAQSRILDPARTATELFSKFVAIQSFPKHLPTHSFPEIFQDL